MTQIFESKKIRLEVQYSDTQLIKTMGAKPYYKDGSFVCWYVPEGMDLTPFRKWWSGKYVHEYNKKNNLTHTLSDYLKFVSAVIRDQFSYSEWIVCNISDISIRNYASLEISDYDDHGNESAKARAVLYGKKMDLLKKFKDTTGMQLSVGHKVMIKISPSFSEKYGMSYSIDDIKPEFTVGDMEAKLHKIREYLKSNGLYDKNKKIPMRPYPRKVAVISPNNAAGLGDFMTISKILSDNELCEFSYFSAFFQGEKIIPSFTEAIQQLKIEHNLAPFDIVCIIRGGGDKAGLYQLNNQDLSEMLSSIDIPLLSGIGHEKDFTIIDEISHTRMATPSMCASYIKDLIFKDLEHTEKLIVESINIIDTIHERETAFLDSSLSHFDTLLDSLLAHEESKIDRISNESCSSLDILIASETNKIENIKIDIDRNIDTIIEQESLELKELFAFIMANNPLAILDKGYSVLSKDGKTIGSSEELNNGDISITFKDKKINAKIEVNNE